jgi:phage gp16-like protein
MADAQRARLIKLLHVGRRELGMAEDSYRAVIASASQGRTQSSKDLRVSELESALEHLKKCGFVVAPAKKAATTRPLANDAQSRKIRALWLSLHGAGKVRDPSEAALVAFVGRMCRVDALQWLTSPQASRVIEHLKQWLDRA